MIGDNLKEEKKNNYWNNKPIMKKNNYYHISKCINEDFINYKNKILPLKKNFSWEKIDINNDKIISVSNFLSEHYKKIFDSQFHLEYDINKIRWEMNYKGYYLILKSFNKIIGTVGCTFKKIQIYNKQVNILQPINMCFTSKYRNKGIFYLFSEKIIEQGLLNGYYVNILCTNTDIPMPIATIRKYFRPINYENLKKHNFIDLKDINNINEIFKIKIKPNKNYIYANKTIENIKIVHNLYNEYMKSFHFNHIMDESDIENYFFNEKFVKTFIIYKDNKPVDFINYLFYSITNSKYTNNNKINIAEIFMYSSNNVRVDLLFINILKQISYDNNDIVYINDIMDSNEIILSKIMNAGQESDDENNQVYFDLNIIKSNHKIFINLFNWQCEKLQQNMISWLLF